ncbi:MAG: succinate dehydrogenase assembly factor 4 [Pseudomonadota bacterium]
MRRLPNTVTVMDSMTDNTDPNQTTSETKDAVADTKKPATKAKKPKEIGGPPGPEPTRYGDWESKGRCTDF